MSGTRVEFSETDNEFFQYSYSIKNLNIQKWPRIFQKEEYLENYIITN